MTMTIKTKRGFYNCLTKKERKMRHLTITEISKLSMKKGVKKVAVENFLSTMGEDYHVAVNNLDMDNVLYRWNAATYNAIMKGILLANLNNIVNKEDTVDYINS